MAELLTVAQFAEQNKESGETRFNSPQKINKAIRDQGAPVDTSTGKRMIDAELWEQWSHDIPIAKGKGNTRKTTQIEGDGGLRPDQVRDNKHGVKAGDYLAYQSGTTDDKFYVEKVTHLAQGGIFVVIDTYYTASPIYQDWKWVNEQLDKGKMKIGEVGDILDILAADLRRLGDVSNSRIIEGVAEQYNDRRWKRDGI